MCTYIRVLRGTKLFIIRLQTDLVEDLSAVTASAEDKDRWRVLYFDQGDEVCV
jgi:hypothetical protein